MVGAGAGRAGCGCGVQDALVVQVVAAADDEEVLTMGVGMTLMSVGTAGVDPAPVGIDDILLILAADGLL